MIKRFSDYDTTRTYDDFKALPKGGYVLQVKKVEVHANSNGEYLQFMCDVAEGEFKDYFTDDYRNQQGEQKKWRCNYLLNIPKDDGTEKDGWSKRNFKTVITNFENSNAGISKFNWQELWFKGRLIGGLFNEREYKKSDGTIGKVASLAKLITVEKIRKGEYKLPEDKLLINNTTNSYSNNNNYYSNQTTMQSNNDGFMNIPDGVNDDDLPFN